MNSSRRGFLKAAAAMGALASPARQLVSQALAAGNESAAPAPARKPNILWLVSEDNCPVLGCYGDQIARTPNLDQLAAQGLRYNYCCSNAPVCAPARSTIITGMYASSLGTQHHRSRYRIPDHVKLLPQYLLQAGYFCVNNGKTDYNIATWPKDMWDAGDDWSGRKEGQPFFFVRNLGICHESSLHKTTVHPEYLAEPFTLPPYHPDTPEIRSNWVEYYHIITKMDAQVGEWLAKLEAAGLADDTIVFYYGDNGGILPRSKRSLYDTGLHVPLLVRYGKNFAHLAPAQPGAAVDRLVSFVDLAPTVLSLAGMEIPTHMQGRAFAGPRVTAPDEFVYGYANRMDDRYDMLRSVCDGRFKYIRNYLPHLIYGQHLAYLWQMPATRSWEQAFKDGKCDATQSAFWHAKPAEELYDTQADPWEVHNLAEDAQYAQQLARLRQANRDHLLAVRDTTFLPEPMMLQRAGKDPIRSMAQDDQRYPIARVLAAAELAAGRDAAAVPKLIQLLGDPDAAVRYWAATGCAIRGRAAATAGDTLTALLKDASADVALAAADALCRLGHADLGTPLLTRYQAQLDTTVGNPEAHTRCLLARNLITAQSESPT